MGIRAHKKLESTKVGRKRIKGTMDYRTDRKQLTRWH